MNGYLTLLINLFAVSACFWMVFGLINILLVKSFIVKRYEQETHLLNTSFFKNHATFTHYLPGFLSSAIYTGHLLMCLWGWRMFGRKKAFEDIDHPEMITNHFSSREIAQIKRHAIAIIIVLLHFLAFSIFMQIWPERFR